MAVVLGYANQTDLSTLAGGSWNASYPITNLRNRYLSQVARTSNALATSSIITVDLGTASSIGVVALISHNLTPSATVRIRGANNSGMTSPVYDSGNVGIYEHTDYAASFSSAYARYWKIDIVDTANPAGYIQIGRLFIGQRFKPTFNCDWGVSLGVESTTEVLASLNGPEYFNDRPNRRTWRGSWANLTDSEAYRTFMTLQRNQDVSGEVYFFEDDEDTTNQDIRWFYARFRTLSTVEWPYVNRHSVGIEIGELL